MAVAATAEHKPISDGVRTSFRVLYLSWSLVIAVFCGWDIYQNYHTEYVNAVAVAMNSYHKDTIYRRWVAMRGGVYVAVSEETPPNPDLAHLPERDITTPTGRKLTLVNPAYMTRQVHELDFSTYGIRGHITSLKPLRKENAPDGWERTALQQFERGSKEFYSLENIAGEPFLRYMHPLVTEGGCLKCHAHQGYKLGDVRGGLSVSVLWTPYLERFKSRLPITVTGHFGVWLLGMAGFMAFRSRQQRYISRQEALVVDLQLHEIKLADSNERFKRLFEESPDAYVLFTNGVVSGANRAAVALIRDEMPRFLGQSLDYFSPQFQPNGQLSRDAADVHIQKTLERGVHTFEWLFRRQDGSVFHGEVTLSVMELENQAVLFASIRDTSVRIRFETQLKAITDSASDAIVMMGPLGAITFWNPAAERMFGYSVEEAVGRNLHSLVAPESYRAAHRDRFPEFQRTGRGAAIGKRVQLVAQRKNGEQIDVELSISAIQLEGGWHATGIIRDITEYKQLEKIRESEQFIRTTLNGLGLYVCVIDSHGAIIITNEGWDSFIESMLSRNTPASASSHYLEVCRLLCSEGWGGYDGIVEAINGVITGESDGYSGEFPVQATDGECWFLLNARGFSLGGIHYTVVSHEDISPLKFAIIEMNEARESAHAANQVKSTFLATMSHEIRTPLSGVIGMTDVLLDTELNDEQREFTEMIRRSGHNLLTVVNDILDFSKIEAGRLEIEIIDFDLRSALEQTTELLSLSAREKGLELSLQIHPSVSSFLRGDPGRLGQIITNLVGNAIKFTPKGDITVKVSVRSEQDDAATILFEICDTGIGIPADRLGALFSPFTQVDGSTSRKYGGTGLGLSICKLLTELMGGKIGATSQVGSGSTFWFTIRYEKQLKEYLPTIMESVSTLSSQIEGSFVLVVDDDEISRLLLTTLLSHWGCRHEEAPDGETALLSLRNAALRGDPFDVALLDQAMPGMDGMELGERIKATQLLARTSLVMVTSFGQRGDVLRLEKYGFSGYLTRPVCAKHLHDCLALVIMKRSDTTDRVPPGVVTEHTIAALCNTTERILLANANPISQKIIIRTLTGLECRVDVVTTGHEVIQALEMRDYKLVLMDSVMGEVDGCAVAELIRAPDSSVINRQVPVIALITDSSGNEFDRCLKAGMDDCLVMPVNRAELEKMLHKWGTGNGQIAKKGKPIFHGEEQS